MYLLYLDDAGSVANKYEEYLVLGGVCVFERRVHWINQELDAIAARIHPSDPTAVEFHASAIWGGRESPWDSMKDKAQRGAVIKDVLRILAKENDSTVAFACAVHKPSFPGRDPMEMAFEDLCSRFDKMLKRIYLRDNDAQRGLLVLDESSHETSLQKLARQFRTLGTRWGVLRNLVDVPLFADSKASRLIQLADHIAYAVYRRYEAGDASYHDVFAHRFDAENGVLHGLAHLGANQSVCMCIACISRRSARQAGSG